ncbi:MAG: NUDIX domain-containing protein [Candidatus Moraniibacteriota bacterium]
MQDNFERFMISQAAVLIREDRCLILQFSDSGKWGLPGGRIDKSETGKAALKRELKEELGIDTFDYLGVADYDFYYYQRGEDRIAKCDVINLIKNDEDEPVLSYEHSAMKWIKEDEVGQYEFAWNNMERMIKNSFKLKKLLENYEK